MDGVVWVHITFLEHGVDLLLRTVNNLPQTLNHLPRRRRNCRNPTTAFPIHAAHTTTATTSSSHATNTATTTTTSSAHAFSLFFLSTPNSQIFPLFLSLVALLIPPRQKKKISMPPTLSLSLFLPTENPLSLSLSRNFFYYYFLRNDNSIFFL